MASTADRGVDTDAREAAKSGSTEHNIAAVVGESENRRGCSAVTPPG
jgi:hypothetical protein